MILVAEYAKFVRYKSRCSVLRTMGIKVQIIMTKTCLSLMSLYDLVAGRGCKGLGLGLGPNPVNMQIIMMKTYFKSEVTT